MANLGKVLYVNAESGLKAHPLRALGINIRNIEVWPEPGEPITFKTLEQLHLELLKAKPGSYAGVVWDSITDIYKVLLEDVVLHAVAKASRAGRERDLFFIDRADYGVMTEQVRTLVRRYRDLPMHFGVAALARREQDDDGAVTYQPAITPALQNDLVGWVDMVCVTSSALVGKEDEYRGLFRPHGKYRGKDRLGALPKYLVDPWFDRLVAYANGDLDATTDEVMIEAAARRASTVEDDAKQLQEN